MRNNMAFRLSAQNSLRMNEVHPDGDKNLLNTFKAGSDLRSQLNKSKLPNKSMRVTKGLDTMSKEQRRSEQDSLAQEVAALDHFKVPVTRDKTKNMIENIKLRRREKHIDTMNRFHEDLDDYKDNLAIIYSSLTNDTEQVMSIKEATMEDYFRSCEDDSYLLSRQKDIVSEIYEQMSSYRIECETKLNYSKEQLERIKNTRGTVVADTCSALREALVEIAFVLEDEARQIEDKERTEIEALQEKYYDEYSLKTDKQIESQKDRTAKIEARGEGVINKWKTLKEEFELKSYQEAANSDEFRRPASLRDLYNQLINLQNENHSNKLKLVRNLIKEDPDTYSKVNINQFNEQLKKINDRFDQQLDALLALFMEEIKSHKERNEKRLEKCKQRMQYIERHTGEEIEAILAEKSSGLCERNITEQNQLMKNATGYVEGHDDKENQVIGAFSQFIMKIAEENDNFVKDFGKLNQQYEIEKAKILDEDDELVEKLNLELNQLKVQLREALHHIKLEEVEKLCFDKVDEIERAYRQCHESNKKLKETRTPSIDAFMVSYEAKLAEIMQLFDPSKRAQLEEKNRQEAEEAAAKRIEQEDKKKAEEEARLIEEAKAKGGKPPPAAKPKDPKKAATQFEERKKAIMAEMGVKPIEELKTNTGSTWLVFKSVEEICRTFYTFTAQKPEDKPEGEQKEQVPNKPEENGDERVKAIDESADEIKDCRDEPVVTGSAFTKVADLVPELGLLREKLFEAVSNKKIRIIQESEDLDEQMLDESLTNLDNRLKAHYSLKGTIESEVYVKRSGEITNHKKKYEKYARTIKDKMDLQTEKFNFLLEKGLERLKQHNTEQKKMKEHIPKCKNLSELQGMYSRTRENSNSFGLTIKEIYSELDRLSGVEIDMLLQKNENFIKESKLMMEGGDYSEQEIKWYGEMMGEITKQMTEQQVKRKEKLEELKEHSEKRKKELLEAFEKDYNLAIEETAAKDGTGKKYGRPKRIAQEKTRLEMNKCEQAQINIDKLISELGREYQSNMSKGFAYQGEPPTLNWREKLMTIQTCITRYGKHIEAFKPQLKIEPMERVNYDETLPSSKLPAEEEEKDKARKDSELKALGKLYEQKDDRVFMRYIDDIEKAISDESRTIYVGDKAKYLTGNDKIPDFLRLYIANMKSNAETFRISCVRDLRESCGKLADLSSCLSELIFSSILSFCSHRQEELQINTVKEFDTFSKEHKNRKEQEMKRLRPNLINPKCQDELKELDAEESKRKAEHTQKVDKLEKQFQDAHFTNAEMFLNKALNNFEFLLALVNSFYLQEDFIKCPGDDIEEKNHLDIKRLMVMKQKGIKIDPTSERNLKRKWEGLDFTVFNIGNRKYEYVKAAEEPKEKDKKGGKKDSKDPKKPVEEIIEGDPNKSKTIETFKTWRQKSAFEHRNRVYENFKEQFCSILNKLSEKVSAERKEDERFCSKWRETADSLYIK